MGGEATYRVMMQPCGTFFSSDIAAGELRKVSSIDLIQSQAISDRRVCRLMSSIPLNVGEVTDDQ